ncbi:MAG: DUF4168 domain-containing protein [Cyanophyceae cyanobacterium]
MISPSIRHYLLFLPKILPRPLTSLTLAATGILIGLPPEVSLLFSDNPASDVAYAQEYSEQQVEQYAQAVLSIEPHRQQAFEDITQIIGRQPPNIVCNQPSSYSSLPDDAQTVAQKYCRTSKQIVESAGLSVAQFNEITRRAQSNNSLESRIQNAMIEIQQR